MSERMLRSADDVPLIVHVVYRLGVGGLENGVINLVNRLPRERFRHAIVCLTEAADFARRIERDDVQIYELHKRDGNDPAVVWRLFRLLRRLRPAVVHTRNLGTLEGQVSAWLARVPVRIHGEHGWDVFDPHGQLRKYQLIRRWHAPLIQRFVPLSGQLEDYLARRVGIAAGRCRRIYNGVDTVRFCPGPTRGLLPAGFAGAGDIVIGTVGRLHGVKDQLTLVRAFLILRERLPTISSTLRLVLIGDGPLRTDCEQLLQAAGAAEQAWLPGSLDAVHELLRAMDIFVLPSIAEGISNTILEAMATGLPVVATAVGGNAELVDDPHSGKLVPPSDPEALAQAMAGYVQDTDLRAQAGRNGRLRVERLFTLEDMLQSYTDLYESELAPRPNRRAISRG